MTQRSAIARWLLCVALLGAALVAITTPLAGPIAAQSANAAPSISAIQASLSGTRTNYAISASDADGDILTFSWSLQSGDAGCNDFTFAGQDASWNHPNEELPPRECSHAASEHPGQITVVVSDGRGGQCTATYPNGSAPGTGPAPSCGGGSSPQQGSPGCSPGCSTGQPSGSTPPSETGSTTTQPATTPGSSTSTVPGTTERTTTTSSTTSSSTTSSTTPPPSSSTTTTTPPRCPTATSGWFEPTQGVWQDDPLDVPPAFADKPGKQLRRVDPASYVAELPLVKDRPTLLFGINHAVGDPPDNTKRKRVVISGVTCGTTEVAVAMRFKGTDTIPNDLDYVARDVEPKTLPLGGPFSSTPRPFTLTLAVPTGVPPQPFTFRGTGNYAITAEIETVDGRATGHRVVVAGRVVATRMPFTLFVPVFLGPGLVTPNGPRLSTLTRTLQNGTHRLARETADHGADYMPLPLGGMPTAAFTTVSDLSRLRLKELDAWDKFWDSWGYEVSQETANYQAIASGLAHGIGTPMGQFGSVGRIVVVALGKDFDRFLSPSAGGLAVSQKVVLVRETGDHWDVLHELTHTMPYLWSTDEMSAKCGVDYHNKTAKHAHGFQITRAGVLAKADRDPYVSYLGHHPNHQHWTDQCTYWQLVDQLQAPPDPELLLVQARVGHIRSQGRDVGQMLPIYDLMGEADLAAGDGGAWAIVQRDAAGRTLARFPFDPHFDLDGFPLEGVYVAHRVPRLPGVAAVEIESPTGVVGRQSVAGAPPILRIVSPLRGARLRPSSRGVRLRWVASGRVPPYATVLLSRDGGETWTTVVQERRVTSVRLPGSVGTYRVKVVASDGGRSREAEVTYRITRRRR